MEIKTQFEDEIAIISLKGRLDASCAQDLRHHFSEINKKKKINFIFDLSELDFIDSTGLGVIISCLKSSMEIRRYLILVGMNYKVRMVFEITRAHKIFDIFDTQKAALDFLKVAEIS